MFAFLVESRAHHVVADDTSTLPLIDPNSATVPPTDTITQQTPAEVEVHLSDVRTRRYSFFAPYARVPLVQLVICITASTAWIILCYQHGVIRHWITLLFLLQAPLIQCACLGATLVFPEKELAGPLLLLQLAVFGCEWDQTHSMLAHTPNAQVLVNQGIRLLTALERPWTIWSAVESCLGISALLLCIDANNHDPILIMVWNGIAICLTLSRGFCQRDQTGIHRLAASSLILWNVLVAAAVYSTSIPDNWVD